MAISVGALAAGNSGSSPGRKAGAAASSPTATPTVEPTATVTRTAPYGDPNSTAVISYGSGFTSAPFIGAPVKVAPSYAVAALHKNVSQGLADLAPGTPQVALRLVTYNSAGSGTPEAGVTSAVDVRDLPVYVIIYNNSPLLRIGGRAVRAAPRTGPAPSPETTSCSFVGLVDANTGKVLTLNQDCG